MRNRHRRNRTSKALDNLHNAIDASGLHLQAELINAQTTQGMSAMGVTAEVHLAGKKRNSASGCTPAAD